MVRQQTTLFATLADNLWHPFLELAGFNLATGNLSARIVEGLLDVSANTVVMRSIPRGTPKPADTDTTGVVRAVGVTMGFGPITDVWQGFELGELWVRNAVDGANGGLGFIGVLDVEGA